MLRTKITRKVKDTSNDIEPGFTTTVIYKEIDCDIQPIKNVEGLETAPAGNLLTLDKMGYLPRFIFEENEWTELFIYPDDQLELLSTNGDKYKIKRVDTYEDHLELLLKLLKT
jgi:uncharacterized protein YllA (UPF0747 family)